MRTFRCDSSVEIFEPVQFGGFFEDVACKGLELVFNLLEGMDRLLIYVQFDRLFEISIFVQDQSFIFLQEFKLDLT
jgi:hypothetical protein